MAKYQADVQTLLRAIGGRENIQAVSHCMTRMRFVLADPAKADTAAIEAIPAVKGTFTQAGQFQVIIGNDVAIFYNEFTACAGIEGVGKDAVKAPPRRTSLCFSGSWVPWARSLPLSSPPSSAAA